MLEASKHGSGRRSILIVCTVTHVSSVTPSFRLISFAEERADGAVERAVRGSVYRCLDGFGRLFRHRTFRRGASLPFIGSSIDRPTLAIPWQGVGRPISVARRFLRVGVRRRTQASPLSVHEDHIESHFAGIDNLAVAIGSSEPQRCRSVDDLRAERCNTQGSSGRPLTNIKGIGGYRTSSLSPPCSRRKQPYARSGHSLTHLDARPGTLSSARRATPRGP